MEATSSALGEEIASLVPLLLLLPVRTGMDGVPLLVQFNIVLKAPAIAVTATLLHTHVLMVTIHRLLHPLAALVDPLVEFGVLFLRLSLALMSPIIALPLQSQLRWHLFPIKVTVALSHPRL